MKLSDFQECSLPTLHFFACGCAKRAMDLENVEKISTEKEALQQRAYLCKMGWIEGQRTKSGREDIRNQLAEKSLLDRDSVSLVLYQALAGSHYFESIHRKASMYDQPKYSLALEVILWAKSFQGSEFTFQNLTNLSALAKTLPHRKFKKLPSFMQEIEKPIFQQACKVITDELFQDAQGIAFHTAWAAEQAIVRQAFPHEVETELEQQSEYGDELALEQFYGQMELLAQTERANQAELLKKLLADEKNARKDLLTTLSSFQEKREALEKENPTINLQRKLEELLF